MSKKTSRVLAGAAIAGAAVIGATAMAPGTAEAAKLPGASKSVNVGGGSVNIRLFDESYNITRSVANNHFSREVLVNGKIRVATSGKVKGASVKAGYLVGCQMNFGAGGEANIGGGAEWGQAPTISRDSDDTNIKGGFKLSPGEAGFFPVVNAKIGDDTVDSFDFTGARGGVAYSGERFGVDGCAGHAQAMAKVTVKVKAPGYVGNVTVYGKPFSIG